jgi:hypothetical protein
MFKNLIGKIAIYLIFIMAIIGIPYMVWNVTYQENIMTIPVEIEIEQSIPMAEMVNRFVLMESVGFGVAGAGGMGAPEMRPFSAKDFINETKGRKIYSVSAFSSKEADNDVVDTYKKTYWSFLESGAIIIYEKEYFYKGYVINGHDQANLYFLSSNALSSFIFAGISFLLTLGLVIWLANNYSFKIFGKNEY